MSSTGHGAVVRAPREDQKDTSSNPSDDLRVNRSDDSDYTEEGDKDENYEHFIYDKIITMEQAIKEMQNKMNDFMIKLQNNMDEKFSKLEDKIFLDTKHDDFMHMVEQKFVKMQERFTKIWSSPRVNIDLLHEQSLDEKEDIFTVPTFMQISDEFSVDYDAERYAM